MDAVLLSGIIHHLPEPSQCAREVFRILKPGGTFAAFDPNRRNPFMYLYRDRSSPFYNSTGVTPNERPVVPEQVAATFADAGFQVAPSDYMSMSYRYIADSRMRYLLSLYNTMESMFFRPWILKRYRGFVLTYGYKP
jgi:SAM-dependent methyltransferase